MHPIIDTAMLKYHKVDYRPEVSKDAPKHATLHIRLIAIFIIGLMALLQLGSGSVA